MVAASSLSTYHLFLVCFLFSLLGFPFGTCQPAYMYYCGSVDGQTMPPALPDSAQTLFVAERDPDESFESMVASPARAYREHYIFGRNELPGNCAKGQLTDIGYTQQLQLGEAMRSFYISKQEFLAENYSAGDIYVRYDSDSRTKQSAMAFCNGLYPPGNGGQGTSEIFDIYTMDDKYDDLSPNTDLCPCLKKYQDESVVSKDYLEWIAEEWVPLEEQVPDVVDCGLAMQCHNMTMPEGITDDLFQELFDAISYQDSITITYPSPQAYGKLALGFLFSEIFDLIGSAVEGSVQPKLALFSGHDSTLESLMNIFNIWDYIWPHYASNKISDTNYVRLVYNGDQLLIPGCDSDLVACTYDDFAALAAQIIPTDSDCESTCTVSA